MLLYNNYIQQTAHYRDGINLKSAMLTSSILQNVCGKEIIIFNLTTEDFNNSIVVVAKQLCICVIKNEFSLGNKNTQHVLTISTIKMLIFSFVEVGKTIQNAKLLEDHFTD